MSGMEAVEPYFHRADLNPDGRISGQGAVAFSQGANLPQHVLARDRVQLAIIEPMTQIDWDAVLIEDRWEEEGTQHVACEKDIYTQLGLADEDEREKSATEEACNTRGGTTNLNGDFGDEGSIVLPCADLPTDERRILYDLNNPVMEPGSLYPSMKDFRLAMRQYAIDNEFELGIEATSTTRYRGYCQGGDCPWSIHARPEMKGSPTIIVTVLNDNHTCRSSGRRKTSTPTSSWVAARALPILVKEPHIGVKELQTNLQNTYKCTIGYDTVWKGKEKALKQLLGSWEDSFQQLFSWKEAVMEKSPDSVIEINLQVEDGRLYFSKFFCALGPCITGFLEGCRPYLSVGSTTLNGRWNGHLVSATSVDGQNWMFPVAYGFFDSETEENWTWFMTQLHKAVGDLPLLAVCYDACKGLTNSVKSVFPSAEKRVCFRHLMNNFGKMYAGSKYMYPAARAYRKEHFDHHIANVRCDPATAAWLDQYHGLLWYRSGFNPAIKCDYITNNIAEMFNNWVKDIKDLPVCDLADKIREMTMQLFHKRRKVGQRFHGKILPSIIHFLKARIRGFGHLEVVKGSDYAAEIRDNNYCHSRHVVNTYLRECSCNEWQQTGKPCHHALSLIMALQFRDAGIEDFVDDYYSVEKFNKAYSRMIGSLEDKSFWPKVDIAKEVSAPLAKRSIGCQRKNRIKRCLEQGSGTKPTRNETERTNKLIRGKFKCPNCGKLGHRKNSYKCPFNGTKKRKRKPRKNTTKGWFPKEVASSSQSPPRMSPPPSQDVGGSLQPPPHMSPLASQDVAASSQPPPHMSPPRQVKRAVRKITSKKKSG